MNELIERQIFISTDKKKKGSSYIRVDGSETFDKPFAAAELAEWLIKDYISDIKSNNDDYEKYDRIETLRELYFRMFLMEDLCHDAKGVVDDYVELFYLIKDFHNWDLDKIEKELIDRLNVCDEKLNEHPYIMSRQGINEVISMLLPEMNSISSNIKIKEYRENFDNENLSVKLYTVLTPKFFFEKELLKDNGEE